jgi:hypothetical protein
MTLRHRRLAIPSRPLSCHRPTCLVRISTRSHCAIPSRPLSRHRPTNLVRISTRSPSAIPSRPLSRPNISRENIDAFTFHLNATTPQPSKPDAMTLFSPWNSCDTTEVASRDPPSHSRAQRFAVCALHLTSPIFDCSFALDRLASAAMYMAPSCASPTSHGSAVHASVANPSSHHLRIAC